MIDIMQPHTIYISPEAREIDTSCEFLIKEKFRALDEVSERRVARTLGFALKFILTEECPQTLKSLENV